MLSFNLKKNTTSYVQLESLFIATALVAVSATDEPDEPAAASLICPIEDQKYVAYVDPNPASCKNPKPPQSPCQEDCKSGCGCILQNVINDKCVDIKDC